MTTFDGGPAGGKSLALSRAPYFLRVVIDASGKVDALDNLEDEPASDEKIFVYVLHQNNGGAFVDGRDPKTGKRWGRFEVMAEYVFFRAQPHDDVLRDITRWREWCQSQPGPHHIEAE